MPNMSPNQIGAVLIRKRLISEPQLAQALLMQKNTPRHHRIGAILVSLGYIDRRQLRTCLKRQNCIKWYAALAACLSAPSLVYGQSLEIEDHPKNQQTKIA